MLNLSKLLLDAIYPEEHYLKTLRRLLHFWAEGNAMANEVKPRSPDV
jgi:hypothetical protein